METRTIMYEEAATRLDKATPEMTDSATLRMAAAALLVCVGYYFTAKIGFAFALQPGSVSTLWMPNSILLAALLLLPRRSWWIVILAAAPAHFAAELQSGVPTAMVLSWFVSNTVQATIGALCVNHFIDGRLRFDRFRDLTIFIIFGVFFAPFLSSFLDITLVKLNVWGDSPYWEIWRIRFFSNVLATLTLVPVIVTWATGRFKMQRRAALGRYVEAGILVVGLLIVAGFVFNSEQRIAYSRPALLYWPLPFLLWAAVRFGPRGASTSILLVMLLVISGATHGQGPFVTNSSADNALAIQVFLICVSIPLMSLAAVIEERRRAEKAAHQNEERLTMALSAAQMVTWDWQIADNRVRWSDNSRRIFALPANEPYTTVDSCYALIAPADRALVQSAVDRALRENSPFEVEFRVVSRGTTKWVLSKGKVLYDEAHQPTRMLGVNIDITERRQAEQALQQSEDRLARAEAFSSVMVTHVGLDGRWLKVPPMLCELLGYTEAELLSGRFQDVTHPDDVEADWNQCQRLIHGEIRSFDLEKRYIHKDGHTIWIFLNCSVVEDDAGRPIHFLTYIKDVTDRKLAEQALLESNERNQAILRALPDMMFLHNKEGIYLDYYARDISALFVPPEHFLGKNVREVLPADLAGRIMDRIERLDGLDETHVLEYSIPINDEERHYEARLVGTEGDKILCIVRDVTEPRRAADALRRSEEKLLESHRQIQALVARIITAQESERRRISLQLHDDLSQNIAALGISISQLKRKLPTSREQITAELNRLGQNMNDLTTQIRRLSHQLHPAALEHLGLVAALESQANEFMREEEIDVRFGAQVRSEKIPFDVSICLYRVALEALRNVSRHSGASSVVILLDEDDDSLTLEVSDSGRGFDVELAKRGGGLGLIGSEERIKMLQGTFEVRSRPEFGATLVARIPLGRAT